MRLALSGHPCRQSGVFGSSYFHSALHLLVRPEKTLARWVQRVIPDRAPMDEATAKVDGAVLHEKWMAPFIQPVTHLLIHSLPVLRLLQLGDDPHLSATQLDRGA